MLKSLAKWGVKKYVLSFVNDILAAKQTNVIKARAIVNACLCKVKILTKFLESLDAKIADNAITADEADAIVAESREVVKELTA